MEAVEGGAWHVYGDYALYACAFSAVVFVVLYGLLSPWRSTSVGRNIMAVMGSLAAGTAYFGWVVWRGGVPVGFWPMRALLFTSIFLAITWRIVIYVRHHVLARLRERDRENEPLG